MSARHLLFLPAIAAVFVLAFLSDSAYRGEPGASAGPDLYEPHIGDGTESACGMFRNPPEVYCERPDLTFDERIDKISADREYIWENSYASSTRQVSTAYSLACGDVEKAIEIINTCECSTPPGWSRCPDSERP